MSNRINKSASNMLFGIVEQVVTLILTFVTRTVFIKVLNENLLGINGLFTNILSILSIAELGFGTAIIYGMYKPIAENDKHKIAALINYYKKIYNILAILIAIVGIAIIPFLKYLINVEGEIKNLVLYYIIFLSDTVCSYLLASKIAIIQANQNYYIIKRYSTFFVVLKNILQILSLIIFKDFIIYLVIQVMITFLTNLYGAFKAKKLYPYAFEKAELEKDEKKKLLDNVKAIAVYKLGGAIMCNTDNILISVISGTVNVGLYSNYNMITSAINRFISIIFNSITASVGNLNAGEDNKRKISIFYDIVFLTNWLVGFSTISIFVLSNDFIGLWIGDKFVLDIFTLLAIALNFYLVGILNPILTYRDTTGIFKQTKYVFLVTAIINLILSIVLGNIWGIFGILIASFIAREMTNSWYEPYILFKDYFRTSPKKYLRMRIINLILIIINSIILVGIFRLLKTYIENVFLCFIFEVILTGLLSNIIFYIAYRNKEELKYFKNLILNFLKKGKR